MGHGYKENLSLSKSLYSPGGPLNETCIKRKKIRSLDVPL
jgi:hypothetical protein